MELPVIFLVDPDVEAAEVVVSHLSAQGWWVSVVQDSDAALQVAAAHAPNLVIVHRRAAPFDGLVDAFSRSAGGPGVILLEIDDQTEVPAGADALLPGVCEGPALVAAARQLIRESSPDEEEATPIVEEPVLPGSEREAETALETPPQKLTSVDIFGDMLDTPVGSDGDPASVVELTRVTEPLDGGGRSVTARVHFTGNAAASGAGETAPRMTGVALADLADPVETEAEESSFVVSDAAATASSHAETEFQPAVDAAPAGLFVEDPPAVETAGAVEDPSAAELSSTTPEAAEVETSEGEAASIAEVSSLATLDPEAPSREPEELSPTHAAQAVSPDPETDSIASLPMEAFDPARFVEVGTEAEPEAETEAELR